MAQANTDDWKCLNCFYLTIKRFCMTNDTVLIPNHTHTCIHTSKLFWRTQLSHKSRQEAVDGMTNAIPANICMVTYGTATTGLILHWQRDTNRKTNLKLRSWSRLLTVSLFLHFSPLCRRVWRPGLPVQFKGFELMQHVLIAGQLQSNRKADLNNTLIPKAMIHSFRWVQWMCRTLRRALLKQATKKQKKRQEPETKHNAALMWVTNGPSAPSTAMKRELQFTRFI